MPTVTTVSVYHAINQLFITICLHVLRQNYKQLLDCMQTPRKYYCLSLWFAKMIIVFSSLSAAVCLHHTTYIIRLGKYFGTSTTPDHVSLIGTEAFLNMGMKGISISMISN